MEVKYLFSTVEYLHRFKSNNPQQYLGLYKHSNKQTQNHMIPNNHNKERSKSSVGKSEMGLRRCVFFLFVMLMVLLASGTNATRVLKGDRMVFGNEGLWNTRLPRGPVPPSAPSQCHNMLDPYKQSQFVSPHDESIICP